MGAGPAAPGEGPAVMADLGGYAVVPVAVETPGGESVRVLSQLSTPGR